MDKTLENWVIISAIILGLGGGLVLLVIHVAPIAVAFFMGLGGSALLYKFLGGISADTTFTTKLFKLSGTAALLMAITWFLNSQLVKQISPNLDQLFEPKWEQWTAVERDSYKPVEILVRGIKILGDNRIPARSDAFTSKELAIVARGDMFIVKPTQDSDFTLGKLRKSDLNGIFFFNQVGKSKEKLYTSGRIHAGLSQVRLQHQLTGDTLPFTMSTLVYRDSISGYSLEDEGGVSFFKGDLAVLEGQVVTYHDQYFIIVVLEANHKGDVTEPYTEFGAYRIRLE